MKIGLVGYFGWGNYGDELFFSYYKARFLGHKLVVFHDSVHNKLKENVEDLIDSVDAIIIGGGDLLIPWAKSWLYWDERFLRKPVFVFGIGVPTWGGLDPEVVKHYQHFLSHQSVKWLSCRDSESRDWIDNHLDLPINVQMFPDMVLAMSFPRLQEKSNSVGLVLRKQPSYEMTYLTKVCEYVEKHQLRLRLIMLGTGRTLHDDYDAVVSAQIGNVDIIVRDNTDVMSKEIAGCDYLLSMKFHGVVAAYKAGTPVIALSGANKFTSFMKDTGNGQYISSIRDEDLPGKFERLMCDDFDFEMRSDLTELSLTGVNLLLDRINAL